MTELTRPLSVIETEISFYKTQTATGIIEIGKRLIEAKAQLQHGEWLPWLKDKIEFSEDTARNFMRVAEQFPNTETIRNLNISKVYALLDVPSEEREEFLQQKHEVKGEQKTVDEMTTRELQKAIADKKKVEEQLRQVEEQLRSEQEYSEEKEKEIEEQESVIKKLKARPAEQVQGKEIVKTVEIVPDDYISIKQKISEYEKERKDNQEKIFNASRLVLAMEDLNFDCNAKLLNEAAKIEKDIGASITYMLSLYKTANGVITDSVHRRLVAMINNMYDLIRTISAGLNLKEANVIHVEEFDNI